MDNCDNNTAKRRTNNPHGRPRSCNWDDAAIQNLALQSYAVGLNLKEVCSLCKSSDDSFYRWLKKNPDFMRRLEETRAKRKTHALNSAYNRAFPNEKEKRGDTPMAMFLLRTQFGMVDPSQHTTIQIANVSQDAKPKEMKKLIEAMPTLSDAELIALAGGQAQLPQAIEAEVVNADDT